MFLIKTLFLDLKFSPFFGGTATMFKLRAELYNPENIIILTQNHENASNFDSSVKYRIIRKRFTLHTIRGFEWVSRALELVVKSFRILFVNKINLLEAARPFPEGIAILILGLLTGKKTVVNFHGEDIAVMKNYFIERFMLKLLIKHVDCILCNSSFTKNLILQLGVKRDKKTYIIYPGFVPIKKSSLNTDLIECMRSSFNGHPVIVTVSRIAERKGHDMVLNAIPELLSEFPSIMYIIAGALDKGEGQDAITRLEKIVSEKEIGDHVKFILNFNDSDRPYILAASDVFVMPNRTLATGETEGYGIVFLEANCLGVPVIGGDSGGVKDAVVNGETGLLVNGNSQRELNDAIKRLLHDRNLREQLISNGYKHSIQMDYHRCFEKYMNAITNLFREE